ncbi:EAL domain-containing protein (putative c-di-GMP-specific phosphodiesterase class I) [Inhella inkyongensis]|uniref:EAL domain-containing protein (Putative c-di-GMP-specific phosphodiesterase class I) n=1 Tax=Inhella inkyongensis TaxID=392593 RepID=A0A840S027_9BURK|nr:EAL domain-containing response regulator [Inhella inkyongensis]MBB5202852.1 EAL domain-containing protein (putative c-di-GMP-specific phosphodiesterase class I) [Inhella inkyongensis]
MAGSDDTVLVVDDDPLFLEILGQQLESLGVRRVLKAERAEQALAWLQAGEPVRTVITDLSMPEVDGPRFLHQLADVGLRPSVVLISAARPDILHSIQALGQSLGLRMAGSLQKPVTLAALEEVLAVATPAAVPARAPAPAPVRSFEVEDLRLALQRRDIRPWYQPKVDAQQLRLVGVEALARWFRPDGRMVSPADFVPVLEEAGLSWELFLCMLEQVLADLAAWQALGWQLKAAVNLSMDCTDRLDLPEQIADRAAAAGVPLTQLTLEVTESRLMNDRVAALETLSRLSLMGATLSIDDFGTGYSSLAQLADLPFGELKVDASFVRRMGQDRKMDRILQTLMAFGRGLGISVVAEGVEHYRQLQGLRALGASIIQGYLVARPMPEAALRAWVSAWQPGLLEGSEGPRLPVLGLGVGRTDEVWEGSPWSTLVPESCPDLAAARAVSAGPDLIFVSLDAVPDEAQLWALRDRWPAACLVLLDGPDDGSAPFLALELGALALRQPLLPAHWRRIAQGLGLSVQGMS